jgi:hypothetical protein
MENRILGLTGVVSYGNWNPMEIMFSVYPSL